MSAVGRIALLVALLAASSMGCPDGAETRKPVETCSDIGQLCRLDDGKIGVCTMTPAESFECVPQH